MHRIQADLCKRGCWVLRTNAGVFYTTDGNPIQIGFPGLSDLIGCNPRGEVFFLEVKVPGGERREEQIKFIDAMKRRGWRAGFVHSPQEAQEVAFGNQNL